jgi:hypothetical protein
VEIIKNKIKWSGVEWSGVEWIEVKRSEVGEVKVAGLLNSMFNFSFC